MLKRSLALTMGLACVSGMWAQDTWPQWRGPNRTGHSKDKGLLDQWQQAPPLVWKAGNLGSAYAGIVVDGNIVCTMGNRNGKTNVIAISDKDGKELWSIKIGGANGRGNSDAMCTPTIDGDRIYAVSGDGNLVCLKTATGELVWEKSFKKEYDGHTQQFGYAESPLIDGDRLICTPGGPKVGMVALNKNTGEEIWRSEVTFAGQRNNPGASYSSVMISNGAGVKQYVQLMKGGLVSVDAASGKQLWSYGKLNAVNSPCTSIIHGDYVFNPCGWYNGSPLLHLQPDGKGGVTYKEEYLISTTKIALNSGGAILIGDHVYASNVQGGMPICVELMTQKMMWPKDRGPGSGPGAIAYADGHLYIQYESGDVALVAATPEKYQLKGSFKLPGNQRGYSHPAISNGRLYLRGNDTIYCYDLKKKAD